MALLGLPDLQLLLPEAASSATVMMSGTSRGDEAGEGVRSTAAPWPAATSSRPRRLGGLEDENDSGARGERFMSSQGGGVVGQHAQGRPGASESTTGRSGDRWWRRRRWRRSGASGLACFIVE